MSKKTGENAVQRLKRRVADRLDSEKDRPRDLRRTQQGLADKLGVTKSTLHEMLNGPASTRGLLAHLDQIAAYFQVPPSLLIHRNDTALMEIAPDEYRLIAHWRNFPTDVQEQISLLFDYFAGFLPEEKEERRLWQRWRRLTPQNRARIDGILEDTLKAQRLAKRATKEEPAATDRTAENRGPAPPRRQGGGGQT